MLGKVEEMSAKELKEALSEAQVDFSDCFEKADLRMRLKSHLSKLNEDMVMKKKQYANNAFARGSFALAIRFYTDALNLLEEGEKSQLMSDQIHSNKSLTFLKMGQAHSALTEARSCDPSYAKGWLRIANALARLGESTKAVAAARRGKKLLDSQSAAADDKTRMEIEERINQELAERGEEHVSPGGEDDSDVELDMAPAHRAPRYDGSPLLETLQDDILVVLLGSFLTAQDVCRVAKTCRHLRNVCVLSTGSVELWRKLCERCWTERATSLEVRDWRTFAWERKCVDERWTIDGFAKATAAVFKFEQAPVFNVQRQGDMLVSAEDCCVKIWDIPRRRLEKTLPTNSSNMVLGVWLHPSQQRCLSGASDGDIKVWDVKSGTVGRVLAGHSGPVVTIHADENLIYTTSFDSTCRIWNWAGHSTQTLVGHHGHVCGLSAQPNEATELWTGADDSLVKLWDIESGRCLMDLQPPADVPQLGSVWCVQAGRNVLVSAATDARVRIWDTSSRQHITRLDGHTGAVAGLWYDEDKIISCGFDGTVRLWDWRTLKSRGVLNMALVNGPGQSASQILHHPRRCTRLTVDDANILVGCIDGCIYQIDVY